MNIGAHFPSTAVDPLCLQQNRAEESSDDDFNPAASGGFVDYGSLQAPCISLPPENGSGEVLPDASGLGLKSAEEVILDQAMADVRKKELGTKRGGRKGVKSALTPDRSQIDIRKFVRPLEPGFNPFDDKNSCKDQPETVAQDEDDDCGIEEGRAESAPETDPKTEALEDLRFKRLKRLKKRPQIDENEVYSLRSRKVRMMRENPSLEDIDMSEVVQNIHQDDRPSREERQGIRSICSFKAVRTLVKKKLQNETCHVVGRENEVEQIFRMIAQSSTGKWQRPLLIGPSGIGKKAIIRKAAYLISQEKCPATLYGRTVVMIDCLSLLANELTQIGREELGVDVRKKIEQVIKHYKKPILFFRDIDKIIEEDYLKDYLKALFRTPLTCIASVSEEYGTDQLNKTASLLVDYNFVPIPVEECSVEDAQNIVKHKMKKHLICDNLTISAEAVKSAVKFSKDYIKDRPLPWKALHLLGETVNQVRGINKAVEQDETSKAVLQAPEILIDAQHVAELMHIKTGKSVERLLASAWDNLALIAKRLNEQVVGQEGAVNTISSRLIKYNMGLCDRNKPWGVFLFAGPTGVGKTELAKCVAKEVSEEGESFIRFDMGEFAESHTISRLIGAPPGYMGHESGGELCTALRKKPHSVILLDEIEKAHPEVRRLFLHVMDEGRLTEATGDKIDCTSAAIIMTSNLGAKELMAASEKNQLNDASVLGHIEKILIKELSPEFCGRVTVVPFSGLHKDQCPKVVSVHLGRIAKRLTKDPGIDLSWDDSLIKHFIKEEYDPKFGMRALCKQVEDNVLGALSEAALEQKQLLKGRIVLKVRKEKIRVVFRG